MKKFHLAYQKQSPTSIIQGVFGELAHEEEAIEAQGVVEEEGSSSTLG